MRSPRERFGSVWTAMSVSLLAMGAFFAFGAVPSAHAIVASCAMNVVVINQNDIPIQGATVTVNPPSATSTTGPSGTVNFTVTCGTVSVSVSASGCSSSTGSFTATGSNGDIVTLTCSPAVSPPPQTGARLNLLTHCDGSTTFPANTAFHIQHGWAWTPNRFGAVVTSWSATATPADIADAESSATYFALFEDGNPAPSPTVYFAYSPTPPDQLYKNFLTNFPGGMTGTHVFLGEWFDQSSSSPEATCTLTVTFTSTTGVPEFPVGLFLLFALMVPVLLALGKRAHASTKTGI